MPEERSEPQTVSREDRARYMRERRARLARINGAARLDTHKPVTCWCEQSNDARLVPVGDIAAGITWSCGAEVCHP